MDPMRQKISFMFSFVTGLLRDGQITDFAIYRSSLENVFKKVVKEATLKEQTEQEDLN